MLSYRGILINAVMDGPYVSLQGHPLLLPSIPPYHDPTLLLYLLPPITCLIYIPSYFPPLSLYLPYTPYRSNMNLLSIVVHLLIQQDVVRLDSCSG